MQRRNTLIALCSTATALLAGLLTALPITAQAQTVLDEVMARKQINIAIPTDFPP